MAIKGKRKSQKKTKPSRPRPVTSTRPTRTPPARPPFHKTFEGQLAGILIGLVVAGFAMFTIAADRAEDAEKASRSDEIRSYTSEIEEVLTSVNESVREMSGAPVNTDDQTAIAGLEDQAKAWVEDLEGAGARAHGIVAPEELVAVNRVFAQAFQTYSGVAKVYRLVPDATGALQKDLLDRATEQRTIANDMVISAIQMLDLARAEVDLGASNLQSPGTLPPLIPTPAASPNPDDTGGKGGGKGKDGDE
ncbi:MAG: hypothetical protein M3277_03180 [Actinomycetota bacterium]|nr:hypothetical protein [Actinomycetota bacterium]